MLKSILNTLSVPMHFALPPIDHLRALLETLALLNTLPWGLHLEKINLGKFSAEFIVPKNASPDKVILYLHGGGFVIGSPHSHRGLVGKIAKMTNMKCLLVDYRKAPENKFPKALEDAYKSYLYLKIIHGIDPKNIIVIGDSAGGGLAMSLLLLLKERHKDQVGATILLSPYVNLANNSDSRHYNAKNDRFLDIFEMRRWVRLYASDHNLMDPLLSPVYGNLDSLPPLLIQCSESEVLYDDALAIYYKAIDANVPATLQTWKGLIHWWHMFTTIPESEDALNKVKEFIEGYFQGGIFYNDNRKMA